MIIKSCIDQKDWESLKKGEEPAFIMAFNLEHLRLWPEKFIPVTLAINEPEEDLAAHIPEPFRGIFKKFFDDVMEKNKKLKEGS